MTVLLVIVEHLLSIMDALVLLMFPSSKSFFFIRERMKKSRHIKIETRIQMVIFFVVNVFVFFFTLGFVCC